MIPLNQQDYYKYFQMFRGNHYKGVTILKTFLANAEIANELVQNVPACASIFTDTTRSTVDALCLNYLVTLQEYYEKAFFTYIHAFGFTSKNTLKEILLDPDEITKFHNSTFYKSLLFKATYYVETFMKLKANFDKYALDTTKTQLSILTDPLLYPKYVALLGTANYTTAYDAKVDAAFSSAAGYTYSAKYGAVYIEKWNQIIVTGRVQHTATTAYRPALVRYKIATDTAELIFIDDTLTQGGSNYESGICPRPAYDASNDDVYLWYNHATNYAYIYCAAVNLTETSFTQLFKGKGFNVTRVDYYTIMNVSAGSGQSSACWNGAPFDNNASYPCISYMTINRAGNAVTGTTALLNNNGYAHAYAGGRIGTITNYPLNVFYKYGTNNPTVGSRNTNYADISAPIANSAGTFNLVTTYSSCYCGAVDTVGNSSCGNVVIDSDLVVLMAFSPGSTSSNGTMVVGGYSRNKSASNITISNTSNLGLAVKRDPFAKLIYVQCGSNYYRWAYEKDSSFVTCTSTEYVQATNWTNASLDGSVRMVATNPYKALLNKRVYDIEPKLLTTL